MADREQYLKPPFAALTVPPVPFGAWVESKPLDLSTNKCGQFYTNTPFLGGWLEVYYCPCETCAAEGGHFFTMFSGEHSGLPSLHFHKAEAAFRFLIDIINAEELAGNQSTRV